MGHVHLLEPAVHCAHRSSSYMHQRVDFPSSGHRAKLDQSIDLLARTTSCRRWSRNLMMALS